MQDSQEDAASKGMKTVDPSDIELQLEDALENQKRKQDQPQSAEKEEKSQSGNMEDLRDPRFFMSKVDDESVEDRDAQPAVINYAKRGSTPSSGPESE